MSDLLTLPTVTSMPGVVHITPDNTLWNIRAAAGSDRLLIERSAYSTVAIDGSNEVPLRDWSPTHAEYEQYRKDNPGLGLPPIEKPDEKSASLASRHIANATTWRAECVDPDWCDVDGTPIAFDSYAEIEQEKLASPDVKAQGVPVYRQGDMHQGIKADAGAHVISKTSQATGYVKITQGQSNVKVNGLPVARHESECLVNCDANGIGGTAGLLRTDFKTLFRQKTQAELVAEIAYFDEARRNADARAAKTQHKLDQARRELSETTPLLDWTRRGQIKDRINQLETQMRARGSDALYYRDQAAHAFAMAHPESAAGPIMSAAPSWNEQREINQRLEAIRKNEARLNAATQSVFAMGASGFADAMGADAETMERFGQAADGLVQARGGRGVRRTASPSSRGRQKVQSKENGTEQPGRGSGTAEEGVHVAGVNSLNKIGLSNRHFLGSLSIPKKTGNSLFVGKREEVAGDLAEIRSGTAVRNGDQFTTSSGRVWGIHNSSVHPISGPGVVNVTSAEYNILVQAQKQGAERAILTMQHMAERNLLTLEQIARTTEIIRMMSGGDGG